MSEAYNIFDSTTNEQDPFASASKKVEQMRQKGNVKVNVFASKEVPQSLEEGLNYCVMFIENMQKLMEDFELTNMELRVLFYILDKMKMGNLFSINQKRLAEQFKTSAPAISRYIKNLQKKGVVVVDEDGNKFINSTLFLKGMIHKLPKEQAENALRAQQTLGMFRKTIREKKKK